MSAFSSGWDCSNPIGIFQETRRDGHFSLERPLAAGFPTQVVSMGPTETGGARAAYPQSEVSMTHPTRIAPPLAIAVFASSAATNAADHAVFVQTNAPAGNAIVVYDRSHDGTLTLAATVPTGGNGSRAIGAPSDPLASQNSLVYDRSHQLLFAMNAGSDTVSVITVDGDELELTQVVSSGGPFPVSIGVQNNLAYVLDAGLTGFVSGFRIDDDHLEPIEASTRTLGLANTNPPFFLSSPAQVGFTPDGKHLLVTTKSFNLVDVFAVEHDGQLSAQPVRNPEAPLPFPFVFGPADLL